MNNNSLKKYYGAYLNQIMALILPNFDLSDDSINNISLGNHDSVYEEIKNSNYFPVFIHEAVHHFQSVFTFNGFIELSHFAAIATFTHICINFAKYLKDKGIYKKTCLPVNDWWINFSKAKISLNKIDKTEQEFIEATIGKLNFLYKDLLSHRINFGLEIKNRSYKKEINKEVKKYPSLVSLNFTDGKSKESHVFFVFKVKKSNKYFLLGSIDIRESMSMAIEMLVAFNYNDTDAYEAFKESSENFFNKCNNLNFDSNKINGFKYYHLFFYFDETLSKYKINLHKNLTTFIAICEIAQNIIFTNATPVLLFVNLVDILAKHYNEISPISLKDHQSFIKEITSFQVSKIILNSTNTEVTNDNIYKYFLEYLLNVINKEKNNMYWNALLPKIFLSETESFLKDATLDSTLTPLFFLNLIENKFEANTLILLSPISLIFRNYSFGLYPADLDYDCRYYTGTLKTLIDLFFLKTSTCFIADTISISGCKHGITRQCVWSLKNVMSFKSKTCFISKFYSELYGLFK